MIEEKMFNVDPATPSIPEVFIKPRETIRIPFKYQTFLGYQASENEKPQEVVFYHLRF